VLQSGKLLTPVFCSEDVCGKRECFIYWYSCDGIGYRRMCERGGARVIYPPREVFVCESDLSTTCRPSASRLNNVFDV
jgi:hypothetical protein